MMDLVFKYIGICVTISAVIVAILGLLMWVLEKTMRGTKTMKVMIEYAFYNKKFKQWLQEKKAKGGGE